MATSTRALELAGQSQGSCRRHRELGSVLKACGCAASGVVLVPDVTRRRCYKEPYRRLLPAPLTRSRTWRVVPAASMHGCPGLPRYLRAGRPYSAWENSTWEITRKYVWLWFAAVTMHA